MVRFASIALLSVVLLLLTDECKPKVFKKTVKESILIGGRTVKPQKKRMPNQMKALIPSGKKIANDDELSPVQLKVSGGVKFNACSTSKKCQNKGTCEPAGGTYFCKCPKGYIGRHCEYLHDPGKCANHLCKNGGVCKPIEGTRTVNSPDFGKPVMKPAEVKERMKHMSIQVSYECECPDKFSGYFCEHNEERTTCAQDRCNFHGVFYEIDAGKPMEMNGTQCKCHCQEYYSGETCEHISPCVNYPSCLNGGKCQTRLGSDGKLEPYCNCTVTVANARALKLRGDYCEIMELDETLARRDCGVPCEVPLKNLLKCLKDEDSVIKEQISKEYDEAIKKYPMAKKFIERGCYNNGKCVPNVYQFGNRNLLLPNCECPKNWHGPFCTDERKKDICRKVQEANLCGHGHCIESETDHGFSCKCDPDYIGTYCHRKNPCRNNPCQGIGGSQGGSLCLVLSDTDIKEASSRDAKVDFACVCAMNQDFEEGVVTIDGEQQNTIQCKEKDGCPKDACNGGYCLNCNIHADFGGALCTAEEKERGFRCICPRGKAGEDCGKVVDACTYHECQNNGACVQEGYLRYSCNCTGTFFKGEFCEIPEDVCLGIGKVTCIHGTCYRDSEYHRGFRCRCADGYHGLDCDIESSFDFMAFYMDNYRYTFPGTMFVVLMPLTILFIVCDRVRICRADKAPRKAPGDPEAGAKDKPKEAESESEEEEENKPKAPKIKPEKQPVGVLPPGGGQRIVF